MSGRTGGCETEMTGTFMCGATGAGETSGAGTGGGGIEIAVAADVGRTSKEFANSGGDGEGCSCS